MVTTVPTGPDAGHTVNVPLPILTCPWLHCAGLADSGGLEDSDGPVANAGDVVTATAEAGDVAGAVGEDGDAVTDARGAVLVAGAVVPRGMGPRDPDAAGAQAVSRAIPATAGTASSFTEGVLIR
jgi:hypothetical protein